MQTLKLQKIFLIRKFWENERPTSTDTEPETPKGWYKALSKLVSNYDRLNLI